MPFVAFPDTAPEQAVADTIVSRVPDLLKIGADLSWVRSCANLGEWDQRLGDPMLCQLSGALADEIGRFPQNRLLVESLIAALIMRVVHCLESPQPKCEPNVARRRLWRVLSHIEAHLDRKLTLAELADVAGLSPPHFSRCFKRAMGTGPQRYVLRRRVERARLLLRQSSDPIASIAARLGFADQSRFTAAFKHEIGVTPKRFRVGQELYE
jgi:AraC family transcriptional regulator